MIATTISHMQIQNKIITIKENQSKSILQNDSAFLEMYADSYKQI